jgi:hypothetical protein
MNNLILNFEKCCDVAKMVRTHCYHNLSKTEFEFPYNTGKCFNFRIKLPRNSQVHSISVSIVPDVNRDIYLKTDDIIDLDDIDWIVYETALFDYEDNIIYDEKFYGDDGINRFDSIRELLEEINTIRGKINMIGGV